MANYIDKKVFHKLLIEYSKNNSKKVYEEIGKSFLLIARNVLNKPNFIDYTPDRKDEMVSDSVFYMCKYIKKYDITRENPFAYFTTIAHNAFLQNINKYSKMDKMFTSIEYIDNINMNDNLL